MTLVRTTGLVGSKASVIAQARQYYCRPARQLRAGAHGVCRQCTALSQVLSQTKDMKKRTETIRFVFVCFGADNRTCREQSERNSETGEFIRYREASALNKLCLSHNRALHGHYVFYLFAMSASLDVRKCFALAALFACGQLQKCRLQTKFADNAVRLVASLLSKQKKEKRTPKGSFF